MANKKGRQQDKARKTMDNNRLVAKEYEKPLQNLNRKIVSIEKFLKEQPNASQEKREAAEKQLKKLIGSDWGLFLKGYSKQKTYATRNNTKEKYNPKTGKFYPKRKKKNLQKKIYEVYTDSFGNTYNVYKAT